MSSTLQELLTKLKQEQLEETKRQTESFKPTDQEVSEWLQKTIKTGKNAGKTYQQLLVTQPDTLAFMHRREGGMQRYLMWNYVTQLMK